jgi:hypothetical protein
MKTKTFLLLCVFFGFGLTQLSGQTIPKGAVIGFHVVNMTLNPNATMNQAMDFLTNKYIPASEKCFPGTKLFLLSGDRGESKFKVAIMEVFESVQVRNKYYPSEDKPTPEADAATKKLQDSLGDTSNLFLDYSTVYTDWIVK